jgi:hypothetical protein
VSSEGTVVGTAQYLTLRCPFLPIKWSTRVLASAIGSAIGAFSFGKAVWVLPSLGVRLTVRRRVCGGACAQW